MAEHAAGGGKVAVIGSGPAGLAAAYFLTLGGHEVTVFEKGDAPGGLLRTVSPPSGFRKGSSIAGSAGRAGSNARCGP